MRAIEVSQQQYEEEHFGNTLKIFCYYINFLQNN